MAKVSVIIPVFKVEAFVGRCAESLFGQTLQDVEYIFVDDATPDKSIEVVKSVLEKYPERKGSTKFIKHAENKGLPAARNTGLAKASGEYVFHCDSDDWVEKDMLEKMYNAAQQNDADVVWCDFYLSFEHNERYMKTPSYASAKEALKGLLGGAMKYNVWNKLVKRSLYTDNDIRFPEGHGMGEDMTMIRLMACAEKVASVHEAFYHYIKTNANAFTQQFSKKQLADIKFNAEKTISFIESKFGSAADEDLAHFKLDVKLPFLISNKKDMHKLWKTWYPEANSYIWANTGHSLKTRILEMSAAKGQFWIIRIYYTMVYKLLYGVIYR